MPIDYTTTTPSRTCSCPRCGFPCDLIPAPVGANPSLVGRLAPCVTCDERRRRYEARRNREQHEQQQHTHAMPPDDVDLADDAVPSYHSHADRRRERQGGRRSDGG